MKIKLYLTVCLFVGMFCRGGIPEAPIVLYGMIKQDIGGGISIRKTQGNVSVTVVPPMGASVTVEAELEDINGQFSYAFQLPCEAVVNPQMNVSSNALMLSPLMLSYSFNGIEIDNQPAQIVGSQSMVLSQNDRGGYYRLDLHATVLPQDTDGDGISDDWELAYFWGAADPAADADGDGVNNLNEYLAGTDPLDSDSYLSFVDVQQNVNGFTVQWASELNRFYRIERSSSLQSGFVPIATGIQGTPPDNQYFDPFDPETESAFYRIVVE